jgi:multicomponent Na+:H+ antiporter subunit E
MITLLTLAIPIALVFMAISGELGLDGFIVGYLLGVLVLYAGRAHTLNLNPVRAPLQLFWLAVYGVRLVWDIFVSSAQVAQMVLSPNIDDVIDPGVVKISTQDETNNEIVTALSSHGITITPGQLVIDITNEDGQAMMHVHNLNLEQSAPTIEQEQTKRLRLIKGILGYRS